LFTLFLVPTVFVLTLDAKHGLVSILGLNADDTPALPVPSVAK